MKMFIRLWCLSSAALLAGCGGGGSGGVASTPTPPAGPAPTNTTLVNLQYSESFAAKAAVNNFSVADAQGTSVATGAPTLGNASVRYDATSQSYTIVGTSLAESTFGAANIDSGDSTASLTVYNKGNGAETLALSKPGTTNPTIALTYTSYGAYQKSGSSLPLAVNSAFVVFGVRTGAASMPKTGTASYQTVLDGFFAGSPGLYALEGSGSFSADFAANTVQFSTVLTGTNAITGAGKAFGSFNGTGAISSDEFSASANNGAYSATMQGIFFGPAAVEFGGAFTLTGADGQGTGVVAGRKN